MSFARHNPELPPIGKSESPLEFVPSELPSPQKCGAERLTVRVATTWEAVEELRPVWLPWTNGLDTDIEHYVQSLKNDKTTVSPYVLSVWKGETPLGILAGQIKERRASATIAMVRVNGPRIRMLEILAKGRMGPESEEVDRLLTSRLGEDLKKSHVDLAFFHRLSTECSLYKSVWHLHNRLTPKRIVHVFSYSVVPLVAPPGIRPAVFSGKIMREARRKTANLRREFDGKVSLRVFSQVEELNEGLNDVERVNEGTWQSAVGSDLTDPMQTADIFRFFAEKGWLRIFVLYVDERPCAFLIGLLHGKTFHCEHAGYHAKFAKYSVGSVLTNLAFEKLAASGLEQVDLGEGGQEHNRRLGCEKNQEATLHVYAPTFRGLSLSFFFGVAQQSKLLGSWTRQTLHLEWAGKKWREFLLRRRAKTRTGESTNRFGEANSSESFGLVAPAPDARSCK